MNLHQRNRLLADRLHRLGYMQAHSETGDGRRVIFNPNTGQEVGAFYPQETERFCLLLELMHSAVEGYIQPPQVENDG